MSVHLQFERDPNDVGAAARGHHFVMCGDECRAHDAALFKAAAAAVALLEVACERPVFERKREHWLKWKLERPSKIFAQMIVDFVATVRLAAIRKNFSRVENIFGIERAFYFAHYFQQLIAKLVAHIFGARDVNAVPGGEQPLNWRTSADVSSATCRNFFRSAAR